MTIKLNIGNEDMEFTLMPLSGYVKTKVRGVKVAVGKEKMEKYQEILNSGDFAVYMRPTDLFNISKLQKDDGSVIDHLKPIVERIEQDLNDIYGDIEKYAICQVLIDTSKLDAKVKEQIEQDVKEDFWQKQNPDEVEKAFSYFLGT